MKRIKVCHIITKLELGGAQQNTLYTVGHLDRSRFEPVLVTGMGGILDDEVRSLPDVPVHFIGNLVRQISPLRDLSAFWSLVRILRSEKPDIVHTHSSKAGILGRWAAKAAGVPVIIHTFHGFGFNDYQKPPVRALFLGAERVTARISDRLIAVTTEDINRGLSLGVGRREQYLLIRSGIDIGRFSGARVDASRKRSELGIPEGNRVVTTIGPFKAQKNLIDFIRIAAKVHERFPLSTFLVVGDGEQRPMIEREIAERGIGDAVKLLGWRRDTAEILRITDIFALTSLWEGLPRSILESMAAGLPVVANAVDGVKEIVRDTATGYLVTPFDVVTASDRITALLEDTSLAKRMGETGSRSIDHQFEIGYMVRQQEDLYRELLHTPADRSSNPL